MRSPVAGHEGVGVDVAPGVLALAALEVAEDLEVAVVLDVDDAAHAEGKLVGDVRPVEPPGVLLQLFVVEKIEARVAVGGVRGPVATRRRRHRSPRCSRRHRGCCRSRAEHLVRGEPEVLATSLRIADVRHEKARGALGLRRPEHVRPIEDRQLLHPEAGILDVRVAFDLDLRRGHREAPVRRPVAGAGGEDAVVDGEVVGPGLRDDIPRK